MIGGLRVGIALREHRLATVVLAGRHVRQVFVLENQEHPGAVLRGELDARRLRVRRASLGLQRGLTTVKELELPPTVGGNLAQMVAFELERHLPFPFEDAVFDFLSVSSASRGGPQRVLVTACERRTVDRNLRLLEEARLSPASLGVACHDLVALLAAGPKTKQAVWAHMVGEEAEVVFLEGRRLRLSRSVPAASGADLAREIGKSLMHLGWEELEGLWISGDQARELLASRDLAELGTTLTSPPLSPHAKQAVAALKSTDGLTLLALATAYGPRYRPLTLLPIGLRPRQVTFGELATASSFAAATLLGVAVLFAQVSQSERHLARLNQAIQDLDPEVKAVGRLASEVERKRQVLTTLETLEESALHPLPLLRELTELIPNDAWLTTLSLGTKGAEMTGQAVAANRLIPLLEGSPRLEKVEFASPVTKGRDKEQFRIRASWETPPKPSLAPAVSPTAAPAGNRSP